MWIFLALVAVPIIEIALFIEVGGWLGLWPTIAIVILTAFLGTVLLRAQGFAALAELQARLQAGQDPSGTLAHGALILAAGIVLLTPGFFTDAIGFALLIPPVRAGVIAWLAKRVTVHATARAEAQARARPANRSTIEGEFEDVTPGDPSNPGTSGWTKGPGS